MESIVLDLTGDNTEGRVYQMVEVEVLGAPNAILSPNIEETIEKYVERGGSESDAFHMLCEGYNGEPDIIKTMQEWAKVFGDDVDEILEQAVEKVGEEMFGETEGGLFVPRLDSALSLQSTPKPFLFEITESRRWSSFVDRFAPMYPRSAIFALFARNAQLRDKNISYNVTQSDPAQFMNQVSRIIYSILGQRPLTAGEFEEFYSKIRSVASHDEACLALVHRTLTELEYGAHDPFTSGVYRRAAQEVRQEAAENIRRIGGGETAASELVPMRLGMINSLVVSDNDIEYVLIDALSGVLTVKQCSNHMDRVIAQLDKDCAVVNSLLEVIFEETQDFEGKGTGANTIAVPEDVAKFRCSFTRLLCSPEVMNLITQSLFTVEHRTYLPNSNNVYEPRRDTLCRLLSCNATVVAIQYNELIVKMMNPAGLKELRDEMAQTYEIIRTTVMICEELKVGCMRFQFKKPFLKALATGAYRVGGVALGILYWAEEGLRKGENERSERAVLFTGRIHLDFVVGVAQVYGGMRKRAFEIVRNGFERKNNDGVSVHDSEKLKDMFLDAMLDFVDIMMGPQLATRFTGYADDPTIDETHLRRFVKETLSKIAPPYHNHFIEAMHSLLKKERVRSACFKDKATKKLILSFNKQTKRRSRN